MRDLHPCFIRESLFSQLAMSSSIILILEIIDKDISRLYSLVKLRKNEVLVNKKSFTVHNEFHKALYVIIIHLNFLLS